MNKRLFSLLFSVTFLVTFFSLKATTLEDAIRQLKDPTLTNLYFCLYSNSIGDEGAKHLANAIRNNITLTDLNLDLGNNYIGVAGAQALGDAIKNNTTLTTLNFNLYKNDIGNAGAEHLANAIRDNTTITTMKLHLARNRIGVRGAKHFANAIRKNRTITNLTLQLGDNNIGDAGVEHLANAIKDNITLTNLNLNLWTNRIEATGAQALANAIRKNKKITNINLNLRWNGIGATGAQALANAIRDNITLTNLNLNLGDNEIEDAILRNINNNIIEVLDRNGKIALFEKGFLDLFKSEELTDVRVKIAQNKNIPVHSIILKIRLGDDAYKKVVNESFLVGRDENIVKAFLEWIYFGFVKTDNKEKVEEICKELKIEFEAKNGIAGFRRDMEKLHSLKDVEGEELKKFAGDFIIKVGENEFKAHKAILAARSGMFINMFLGTTEGENSVILPIDLSENAVKALIEFIYTGKITNVTRKIKKELLDEEVEEYFQLPQNSLRMYLGV